MFILTIPPYIPLAYKFVATLVLKDLTPDFFQRDLKDVYGVYKDIF